MFSFKDKVVIVTGGTDGIGRALVDRLIADGAKVATCSRNYDKLYQLQLEYSNKPLMIQRADVSFKEDCHRLIELTIKTFGTIDVLINNAGVSMRALFAEMELETMQRVMDVNFWGAVYCTKYALPYLQQTKGIIVGVSSIAAYRGLPGRSGYSASKAALNAWMETIRVELSDAGIHVMWVCPGFTASNIRQSALNAQAKPEAESLMDEGAMMSADTCASHILNAVARKKRTLTLTAQGREAIWLNRFFPAWTDKLIRRFYYKDGQLIK